MNFTPSESLKGARSAIVFHLTTIRRFAYNPTMKRAKRYTEAEARELLNEAIRKAGPQAAFADSHRMSRAYLSDVVKGG